MTCWDRSLDQLVQLVDVHLAPGAQRAGRYDDRRPLTAAHHRRQLADLARVLASLQPAGPTYVVGDFNFDGVQLPGLVSAWEGRRDDPGTLGRRHVDDVQALKQAREVRLVETASDHRAVLATYV
jgi:endonuclease/exonuclease/phosphatase (EEP) superfamily protein YafD